MLACARAPRKKAARRRLLAELQESPPLARESLAAGWLHGNWLISRVRHRNRYRGLGRFLLALAGKVVAGGEVLVELAGQLRRTGAKCRPATFEEENRDQAALWRVSE
jgi:hypothetical protein